MSDKYYVRFRGRVVGPMPPEKLKNLVARGQVSRVHEVSPDGVSWQSAEDLEGLFPKSRSEEPSEKAESGPPQQTKEWYYAQDGQRVGPCTLEELLVLVRSGVVSFDTPVFMNGMSDWVDAGKQFPAQFSAPQITPAAGEVSSSSGGSEENVRKDEEVFKPVSQELKRNRSWVYLLSITALVINAIWLLGSVTLVIRAFFGAEAAGTLAIVLFLATLLNFALNILGFTTFVVLVQYANSLSVLQYSSDPRHLSNSLKKLSRFWKLAGIWVLTVLLLALSVVIYAQVTGSLLL